MPARCGRSAPERSPRRPEVALSCAKLQFRSFPNSATTRRPTPSWGVQEAPQKTELPRAEIVGSADRTREGQSDSDVGGSGCTAVGAGVGVGTGLDKIGVRFRIDRNTPYSSNPAFIDALDSDPTTNPFEPLDAPALPGDIDDDGVLDVLDRDALIAVLLGNP